MEIEILIYIISGAVALSGLGVFVFRKGNKKSLPSDSRESLPEKRIETAPTTPKPTEPIEIVDEKPQVSRKDYRSLEDALAKTRAGFWGKVKAQFSGQQTISASEIEELEEALYTSDLGPKTVDHLIAKVSASMNGDDYNLESLHQSLKGELNSIFKNASTTQLETDPEKKTSVWMVVGVNGAGKTTTIGKLANQQVEKGKKVLIAAGDTFRAAADAQLKVWATRAEVEIFSPEGIKDPSAVAFDAVQKGVSKGFDLVIIDTAGRLHTQKNLMEELKKMKRVMAKALEGSPDETILVLDANSGQNALMQTEQFHEALGVSGVILTKMDGSAKGGVAVGIACEHQLPIKMIGVGEKIEDLRPFNATEFVDSIL